MPAAALSCSVWFESATSHRCPETRLLQSMTIGLAKGRVGRLDSERRRLSRRSIQKVSDEGADRVGRLPPAGARLGNPVGHREAATFKVTKALNHPIEDARRFPSDTMF